MLTTCVMVKQWRFVLANGRNALILTVVSLKMLYCLWISTQVCAMLTERGKFQCYFCQLDSVSCSDFLFAWLVFSCAEKTFINFTGTREHTGFEQV